MNLTATYKTAPPPTLAGSSGRASLLIPIPPPWILSIPRTLGCIRVSCVLPNVAMLCIVLINPVRECGAILLSSPYSASHELRPDTSPEQLELEWLLLAVQTAVARTAQLLTRAPAAAGAV